MVEDSHFPGRHWRTIDDKHIECQLCPRFCKLKDGQRGLCFVRKNEGQQMILTTYGKSSGFCIDPVEKKPLNHFYPGSPVLSFGTAGCNLFCRFCQNWDISKARDMDKLGSAMPPEAIAQLATEHKCLAVAYTYNDPVIFLEYAVDTAQACHDLGIKNIAVSAGYITEQARPDFYRYMDAANIDLKCFSESFYKKICGGQLQSVLETLCYLKHETDIWFEITTLLIPDENDSEQELEAECQWIYDNLGPDVPLHFSAFHPDFKMRNKDRTPASTLLKACRIAKEAGLHYVYVGNIHNEAHDSTYCPSCHKCVIGRDWYELTDWQLDAQGRCLSCGTQLAGRFSDNVGNWGAKRRVVG